MTRNQRKAAAKAKLAVLIAAQAEAFKAEAERNAIEAERLAIIASKGTRYAPGDVKGTRSRVGIVSRGSFMPRDVKQVTRKLTLNAESGKMIERRNRMVR